MFKLQNKDILHFRFSKLGNWKFFISNDYWSWLTLDENNFNKFVSWKNISKELKQKLINSWFMINKKLTINQNKLLLASKWASRYKYLFYWPFLHIIVVNLNCNHSCLYCHASATNVSSDKYKMNKDVAKKVVDVIFQTTSWTINIEFQWWEPLLNWDVVKYVIGYSKEKNKKFKLDMRLSIVTNLTLMDDEKMTYLLDNNVWISTSLDGDEHVHNYNRKFVWWKNSHKEVIKWIKKINDYAKKLWKQNYQVWAIATVTKESLKYPKQIIDTYVKLWLKRIFIRPLNPYWFASKIWNDIWYNQDQYIKFYNNFIKYIKKLNKDWYDITDTYIDICKNNLNNLQRAHYTEEMSPICGASLGQVAYNYDGSIYTCDEGRMIASSGDNNFKIWDVDLNKTSKQIYEDLILSHVTKMISYSSMIDFIPWYDKSPYSNFIWVCPIYSYVSNWNIISKYKKDDRFKLQKWVFDKLLENK